MSGGKSTTREAAPFLRPPAGGEGEAPGSPRHLLSVSDLGPEGIAEILRLTESFVEVSNRTIPKVPSLRGKTVVSLFYENSTRTRLSFETAARRLSADVMTFAVGSSSVSKGESIRDTIFTICAMGVDAIVVRHGSAGVPWQIARWLQEAPNLHGSPRLSGSGIAVINGGDGAHEHPTQALLDCYTLLAERHRRKVGPGISEAGAKPMAGLRVGVVGDIRHSRVARSEVLALTALGAEVVLVAPPTLLPPSLQGWPVQVSHDLDSVVGDLDAVYLLRLQQERMTEALLPSLREYHSLYGLDEARADRMKDGSLIMHPGPVNRGVEVTAEVADRPNSVITHQVSNGVAVRMAVLFRLVGSGVTLGI